jgi:integrase
MPARNSNQVTKNVCEVKRGSVVVKIYPGKVGKYQTWLVRYHYAGQQHEFRRASLDVAKQEAGIIADKISLDKASGVSLSSSDIASLTRARELLSGLDVPIEVAIAEYAECRRMLGSVPLIDAVRDFYSRFAELHQITQKTVREALKEMLRDKERDGVSPAYLKNLRYHLGKLSTAFPVEHLHELRADNLNEFLRSVPVGPKVRNGLRTSIQVLYAWSKLNRVVPDGWNELARVPRAKEIRSPVKILLPSELIRLLESLGPRHRFIPFFAIAALAGIRTSEITRLDWRDVGESYITVDAHKAKTAARRLVPISDNLREWIAPHRKAKGRVIPHHAITDLVAKLARSAGVEWSQNVLRHSAISYRVALVGDVAQVALESGNSAAKIFQHYRELVSKEQSLEWFAIVPTVTNL